MGCLCLFVCLFVFTPQWKEPKWRGRNLGCNTAAAAFNSCNFPRARDLHPVLVHSLHQLSPRVKVCGFPETGVPLLDGLVDFGHVGGAGALGAAQPGTRFICGAPLRAASSAPGFSGAPRAAQDTRTPASDTSTEPSARPDVASAAERKSRPKGRRVRTFWDAGSLGRTVTGCLYCDRLNLYYCMVLFRGNYFPSACKLVGLCEREALVKKIDTLLLIDHIYYICLRSTTFQSVIN